MTTQEKKNALSLNSMLDYKDYRARLSRNKVGRALDLGAYVISLTLKDNLHGKHQKIDQIVCVKSCTMIDLAKKLMNEVAYNRAGLDALINGLNEGVEGGYREFSVLINIDQNLCEVKVANVLRPFSSI